MANKTKLQKLIGMIMKMQKKKFTRNLMSKMIRELIDWVNASGITDDELFVKAEEFLKLPVEERLNGLKYWKIGKKFMYKCMANLKGKKILKDQETVNDILSVINDLKGWWRTAPEKKEMDFFTRFLQCINKTDVCDLREQVKNSVKKTAFLRKKK